MTRLGNQQIIDAGLADWRKLAQPIHAHFRSPDLAATAAFVGAVSELDDQVDAHLSVRITGHAVDLSLATRAADGMWVTQADVDLARGISAVARTHGLVADPSGVTQLELGLDTAHHERVGPFWAALMTGSPDNTVADSVFDPAGLVPAIWFQDTEDHATPRQRWHFDLWLAPEVAQPRIAAAVAAGGRVVDDAEAPAFTVLADPDGNKVCVCTATGR